MLAIVLPHSLRAFMTVTERHWADMDQTTHLPSALQATFAQAMWLWCWRQPINPARPRFITTSRRSGLTVWLASYSLLPERCARRYIGKSSGHHSLQEDINQLLADLALQGLRVARLKRR